MVSAFKEGKVSEERAEETRAEAAPHTVDEVLPAGRLAVLGFQHVLAMYAGAVAVPLILANAIGLPSDQLVYLINADLFTCGVATLIQTVGLWKVGFRLPIIQGVTFAAVTPMILIGEAGGLPAIYGSVIVAGIITFLVSPFFSRLLRFFPPVVIGSIITIIGVSLLPVAVTWAGGDPSADDGFVRRLPAGDADRAQQRHHRWQHRRHRPQRRLQHPRRRGRRS